MLPASLLPGAAPARRAFIPPTLPPGVRGGDPGGQPFGTEHGVPPGIHCASAETVNHRIAEGWRFMGILGDLRFLTAGAKAARDAIRTDLAMKLGLALPFTQAFPPLQAVAH